MAKKDEVARLCGDKSITVVCHPSPCDSVAFYLRRDDLQHFRSKETENFVRFLRERPRTVVLFTHRHSLVGFRQFLPDDLEVKGVWHQGLGGMAGVPDWVMDKVGSMMGETSLGLCDIAVIERKP